MSNLKLQITHNDVLVVDLVTDDIEEVKHSLNRFEYELGEMISGANNDDN